MVPEDGEHSSSTPQTNDRNVAIGIVGFGPVGTIALHDCDRPAAAPLGATARGVRAQVCAQPDERDAQDGGS
jgi:hypothetical protein